MLISLVLTTFRRPDLLPRAARSVLDQDLPAGVRCELIVADDDPKGSALAALPALHSESSDRLKIVYVKRDGASGGVAHSRNRALAIARGDWIAFLDDDDLLLPGALRALAQAAGQSDCDFVAGAYEQVKEDGSGQALARMFTAPQWSHVQLLLQNLFPIGSFMIRRDCLLVPFHPMMRTHEDWLFLLDNLGLHSKVKLVDAAVLEIRQAVDASRDHRNASGGVTQKADDFARIYALHPAPSLAAERRAVLQRLGGTSLEAMMGAAPNDRALQYRVTNQGHFLICNPLETIQSALLREGHFEPLAAKVAEAILALRPGAVIDVGANIGAFSIPVARGRPQCTIVSVEPQRMVFMHLCANALGNRLANLRPVNAAVAPEGSRRSVPVPFFDVFTERYTGSVSLDAYVQRTRGSIAAVAEPSQWATSYDEVSLTTLDVLSAGLDVSFVKIDVEGMEEAVLRSGQALLETQRPSLFFEAWSLPQFREQRRSLLMYVLSLGYVVLQLGEDCFAHHPQVLDSDRVARALRSIGLKMPTVD